MEMQIYLKKKKPGKDYMDAIKEYAKRMSTFSKVSIKSVGSLCPSTMRISPHTHLFLVVPGNNSPSSEELANLINDMRVGGISRMIFIICENNAEYTEAKALCAQYAMSDIAISSFELHGELAAVALTEQLYRAFTILNHITYHK